MMNTHPEGYAKRYAVHMPHTFPLLPGLLVLSAMLHLCAVMIWPSDIPPPSTGLKQLALEIQRQAPPGTQTPARPHKEEPATHTAQTTTTSVIQTTGPTPAKQQNSVLANKSATPEKREAQQQKLSHAQLEERLHGHLQQALLPHFSYPDIARRRGWEGTVRISLRVEPDGRLTNLQVIENSTFTSLKRAALHSLQQVSGIPAAKQWLAGRHLDMVLPIRYRLLDS